MKPLDIIVVNMPKPIHKSRRNAETLESMLSRRFSLVRLYSSSVETRSWVVAISLYPISSRLDFVGEIIFVQFLDDISGFGNYPDVVVNHQTSKFLSVNEANELVAC